MKEKKENAVEDNESPCSFNGLFTSSERIARNLATFRAIFALFAVCAQYSSRLSQLPISFAFWFLFLLPLAAHCPQ